MTTRTWNGAAGTFDTAADWSGDAVPVAGDTAVINSGTVIARGLLPVPLTIAMDGASGPTLGLANATLQRGTSLQANDEANFAAISVAGTSVNAGAVTFTGQAAGAANVLLQDTPGAATAFVNVGGISVVGQDAVFVNEGFTVANAVVNDGVISFRSGGSTGHLEIINANVSGTGTIRVQPNTSLVLGGSVGAGQTILFEPGAGASNVSIGSGLQFGAVISGFGSSDQVMLSTTPYDSYSYSLANGIGTFTFTSGGTVVGTARFDGNQPQSVFSVTKQVNSAVTTIRTSVPNEPARLSFTDPANGVSGNEAATAYHDPNVPNLQYAYLWSSSDGVAVSGNVPNMFIHGGSGDDAISVSSGSNVLDGGPGSNFLVGGTGADGGTDQFFLDGRGGQVTFSTVVNFHVGDTATIFGFVGGVSTSNWEASGGAVGYQGATLHSALSGPGTTVNASLAFAGIDISTASAHFQITAGSNGGEPFLLIKYV